MDLYRLGDFPNGSDFLIVDKLIHGCGITDCKRKLMGKTKDVTVKACLDVLRQYEAISTTMKHLSTNPSQVPVNANYSHDPMKRSQKKRQQTQAEKNTKLKT